MAKVEKQRLSQGSENIHPQLHSLIVSIDDLNLDPNNARLHSDRNLEAIKSSFQKFGQRKPIVVRREGMVIEAGNGSYEAAKALGWKSIAAVICDDELQIAKAYSIADNRSAELATWDEEQLAESLKYLSTCEDIDVSVTGFDLEEVDEYIRIIQGDLTDVEGAYTKKIEAPIYTPKGDNPPVSQLFDQAKSASLIEDIVSRAEKGKSERLFYYDY